MSGWLIDLAKVWSAIKGIRNTDSVYNNIHTLDTFHIRTGHENTLFPQHEAREMSPCYINLVWSGICLALICHQKNLFIFFFFHVLNQQCGFNTHGETEESICVLYPRV